MLKPWDEKEISKKKKSVIIFYNGERTTINTEP